MSYKAEERLIAGMLTQQSFKEVAKLGIKEEDFSEELLRGAYRFIASRAKEAVVPDTMPTKEEVEKAFNLTLKVNGESFPQLVELVRRNTVKTKMARLWGETEEKAKEDPIEAARILVAKAAGILTHAEDTALRSQTMAGYSLLAEAEMLDRRGFLGYKWPWESFNQGYSGIEPGLFFFYGTPKIGKTWIVLNVVKHILLTYPDVRILVWHAEGRTSELQKRLTQLMAGLPSADIPFSLMEPEHVDSLMETEEWMQAHADQVIFAGNAAHLRGIAGIDAAYQRFKPDLIFVDSGYITAGDLDWKVLMTFVYELATRVADWDIPVLLTGQDDIAKSANTKDKKAKNTTAFSNMQHAAVDASIRILGRQNPMTNAEERELIFTFHRKQPPIDGITIRYNPGGELDEVYAGVVNDEADESGGELDNKNVLVLKDAVRKIKGRR